MPSTPNCTPLLASRKGMPTISARAVPISPSNPWAPLGSSANTAFFRLSREEEPCSLLSRNELRSELVMCHVCT